MLKTTCGLSLIALLPKESAAFVANPLASRQAAKPCVPDSFFPQAQQCQHRSNFAAVSGPLSMMKDQKEPFFFANTIMNNNKKRSPTGGATGSTNGGSSVGPLPMMSGNDFSSFQQSSNYLLTEESSYTGSSNSNQFHSSQQYQEQGRKHHKNAAQSFFSMFSGNDGTENINDMEQEIMASTQAKLDVQRIKNAFFQDGNDNKDDDVKTASTRTAKTIDTAAVSVYDEDKTSSSVFETVTIKPNPSTTWSIAVASGSVLGLLSFIALQVPLLSLTVFLLTTYVASRDPTLDEDLVAGDLTGPVTRTLGRFTLDVMESMKPTVKAVVRAVVSGDEMIEIKNTNQELRDENDNLRMEMARKEAVEDLKKHYTVKTLKEIAKRDGLKVSGNKAELMMRLIENDSIPLQSPVKN